MNTGNDFAGANLGGDSFLGPEVDIRTGTPGGGCGTAFYMKAGDLNCKGVHFHGSSGQISTSQGTYLAYFGGHNNKITAVHFEGGTGGIPKNMVALDGNNVIADLWIGQNNGTNTTPCHGLKLMSSHSGIVKVVLFPSGISSASNSDAIWSASAAIEGTLEYYVNDDNATGFMYRNALNLTAGNKMNVVGGVSTARNNPAWPAGSGPATAAPVVHNGVVLLTQNHTIVTSSVGGTGQTLTPDLSAGDGFTRTVTGTTAGSTLAIAAPTNPTTGDEITIVVKNGTTTTGTVVTTFNATYKFNHGAWTDPAQTKSRMARFKYDGTQWNATVAVSNDY